MKHTKEPWSVCGCGKCDQILDSGKRPIASVESGEIGDSYPAIRPVGSSIGGKYEAYTEFIPYGEIPEKEAEANAARIVACVNACAWMENPEKQIKSLLEGNDDH